MEMKHARRLGRRAPNCSTSRMMRAGYSTTNIESQNTDTTHNMRRQHPPLRHISNSSINTTNVLQRRALATSRWGT